VNILIYYSVWVYLTVPMPRGPRDSETTPDCTSSRIPYGSSTRSQVIEAVNLFRAKVVDVSTESLTVEATGTPEKLEALLRVLEPYGIRELAQSGVVSLSRGPRGIGTVK